MWIPCLDNFLFLYSFQETKFIQQISLRVMAEYVAGYQVSGNKQWAARISGRCVAASTSCASSPSSWPAWRGSPLTSGRSWRVPSPATSGHVASKPRCSFEIHKHWNLHWIMMAEYTKMFIVNNYVSSSTSATLWPFVTGPPSWRTRTRTPPSGTRSPPWNSSLSSGWSWQHSRRQLRANLRLWSQRRYHPLLRANTWDWSEAGQGESLHGGQQGPVPGGNHRHHEDLPLRPPHRGHGHPHPLHRGAGRGYWPRQPRSPGKEW